MKILNLYAGLGGNRLGWEEIPDIKVTAVEKDGYIASLYKKRFKKDEIIVGDAIEYVRLYADEYDFIWASPPCVSHSQTNMAVFYTQNIKRLPDLTSLYGLIIFLNTFHKKIGYCVENVKPYYKPLITPSISIGRHNYWVNYPIEKERFIKKYRRAYNTLGIGSLKKIYNVNIEINGLDTIKKRQILRNCCDPNISRYFLKQFLLQKKQLLLNDYIL